MASIILEGGSPWDNPDARLVDAGGPASFSLLPQLIDGNLEGVTIIDLPDVDPMLPDNSGPAEIAMATAIAAAFAFDVPNATLWDPLRCPAIFLPWLAWALSVDEWNADWSEGAKRAVVAEAAMIHRIKGTPTSVRRALISAGYGDAVIEERFGARQYDATIPRDGTVARAGASAWAEYRIILARPMSIEQAAQVRRILSATAPARSKLKALDYQEAANLYNSTVPRDGTFSRGVS